MATTPYPLPRETRETEIRVGNGGKTYGPFGFRIFDVEDVRAFVKPEGADDFVPAVVTAAKVAGHPLDHFTVTFAENLPATARFIVQAARLHARETAVTKAGVLQAAELEKELSKQGSVIEELRRDVDRGGSAVPVEPGRVLIAGEDGRMRPGPDVAGIIEAGESAVDAAAAAATSEANADADALATATDRVQTGLDAVATAADRVQTGLDAAATAADRVQTGLDAVATAADRAQTGLDATATAADRVQTGLDAAATAADRVQTGADRVQTGLDAIATAADRVQTELDAIAAGSARAKAQEWATKAEDVPVESGPDRYSAFHWAQKAAALVLGGLAGMINAAPAKATPADNDRFPLTDSDAGYAIKRIAWNDIKAALGAVFLPLTGGAMTGPLVLPASTTAATSLHIEPGTDPVAPANGDVWINGAGNGVLRLRRGGVTTYLWDSSSLALISKADAEAGTSTLVRLWSAERVAQAIAALTPPGLGVGQTWQDVAASRSIGTSYQNTTGRPIEVNIVVPPTSGIHPRLQVSTDNSIWTEIGYGNNGVTTLHGIAVIPAGYYYRVNQGSSIAIWAELR